VSVLTQRISAKAAIQRSACTCTRR